MNCWLYIDQNTLFFSCTTGDKPKLKQLQKLVCPSGVTLKVIKSVAAKWESIAIALDIDYSTEQRDFSHVEAACIAILRRWIDGEGEQPATWNTLIGALEDADYLNLAKDLRKELGSSI